MIKSYFFIPANKIKKGIKFSGIDYKIIDFEDSVLESEINKSLSYLGNIEHQRDDIIRVPIDTHLMKIVKTTTQFGYKKFMIPKFNGYREFAEIYSKIKQVNEEATFILLIEQPRALIELTQIIEQYSEFIDGVCLGSHDFSFASGITSDEIYLRQIRIDILVKAKAYNIEPIDIVSMNISDKRLLEEELLDSFKCGYRSKLLIHPFQLEVLNKFQFYSREEVESYNGILNYYKENIKGKEALFVYNGKVYEKMHLREFQKIVEWGNAYYGTNR